jgi:RNA-directed DNA polymerase
MSLTPTYQKLPKSIRFKRCQNAHQLNKLIGRNERYIERALSDGYQEFEIKKRKGGTRMIEAPNQRLKNLQHELVKLLTPIYQSRAHKCAYGHQSVDKSDKKGIRENASMHLNADTIYNYDISNFYPSIKFDMITKIFSIAPFNFSDELSKYISILVTCNGHLPTGSPSSPIISNIICWWLDETLNALSFGLTYTRYVDDLTFSGELQIEEQAFNKMLVSQLSSYNFTLNEKKTRKSGPYSRKVVTGVVVNEKLNVNRKYIRKVRACFHHIELGNTVLRNEKNEDSFKNLHQQQINKLNKVKGMISFISSIRGKQDSIVQKFNAQHAHLTSVLPNKSQAKISAVKEVVARNINSYKCLVNYGDKFSSIYNAYDSIFKWLLSVDYSIKGLNLGELYSEDDDAMFHDCAACGTELFGCTCEVELSKERWMLFIDIHNRVMDENHAKHINDFTLFNFFDFFERKSQLSQEDLEDIFYNVSTLSS